MNNIGIVYSTTDGQTKKITEFLLARLNKEDSRVSLFNISDFSENILNFDVLVIGASIRYGKHSEQIMKFINDHQAELEKIHTAFFSVNLVARKSDKDRAETNPYVIKFLASINWKPDAVDVFAGCLDYSKYGFFDRLMIRAIMLFTHGPTSTKEPIEYTDWNRVSSFGAKVITLGDRETPPSAKITNPIYA